MRKLIDRYSGYLTQWLKRNQAVLLTLFILGVIGDVYGFNIYSDSRLVLLLLLYWFYIRLNNVRSKTTFLLTLIFLVVMFISFLAKGANAQTERIAVWFYLLLAFGIIQQWQELE